MKIKFWSAVRGFAFTVVGAQWFSVSDFENIFVELVFTIIGLLLGSLGIYEIVEGITLTSDEDITDENSDDILFK